MAFRYSFELNGVELKDISIGSTVIDKLEEPLDEGAFKLAFTTREIEYRMLGYLKIRVKDYNDIDDNNVIEFEYIVISDEVSEGSKYGDFIHDLVVVEYTHKYDKYLVHSLAKTKIFKDNNKAKFEFYPRTNVDVEYNKPLGDYAYNLRVWLPKLEVFASYYENDGLVFKRQVNKFDIETPLETSKGVRAVGDYGFYTFVDIYVKVTNLKTGIVQTSTTGETMPLLSDSSVDEVKYKIDGGDYVVEYGFIYEDTSTPPEPSYPQWLYKFYTRVIPNEFLSVYDILEMVRTNISKYGGIESKLNFDKTRLFNIDPLIADKLKQIEVPQTYIQKATLRQVLNSIFLYVNSISRVKRDNNIDILTMDEFNEVVGSFEMKNISSYNSSQDSQELASKGVSWLERVLPDNRERPNIIEPSANGFKTVRSTNIQILSNKFGLELSKPMYEPKKLSVNLGQIVVYNYEPSGEELYRIDNFVVDLSPRFINKSEWALKKITTSFPSVETELAFDGKVGLRENKVANLSWEENTTYIDFSEVYGNLFQEALIINVIKEAINEQITRQMLKPSFYFDYNDQEWFLRQNYRYQFLNNGTLKNIEQLEWQYLKFNIEYISQEDVTVETERDDLTYLDFYSESRLNQSDKLINVASASRKNYGDMQRSGLPNKTFQKIHTNVNSILKVGLQDRNGFVITVRKLQFYNDYILATYSATKDHNRLSQFIGLQQSYRAFEIPTSSQIFERIETYRDYVYITNPNEIIDEELTYIYSDNTLSLLFGNLINDWLDLITNGNTRVTVSFVRTDAFVKRYDDGLYFHAIATPVNAFGKKGGVVFQFGFDNNQIALNAVETLLPIGNIDFLKQRYNKAIKYTDDFGKIDELWFMLSNSMLMGSGSDWDEIEVVDNYPLVRDNDPTDTQVFGAKTILFRSGDMRPQTPHYNPLIITKDSSQNIKIPYHLQVLAKDFKEYVIGDAFYTENFLVKNPNVINDDTVGTKMYVYIYENNTFYGKFDDLLIKNGYNKVEELISGFNVTINHLLNRFRFTGDLLSKITENSNWAIGDEFENLYLACNHNYSGFNFYKKHFREGLLEIGQQAIEPFVNILVNDIIVDFYLTTETLSEMETLFVGGYDYSVGYFAYLMANILFDSNISDVSIDYDVISETMDLVVDGFSTNIIFIYNLNGNINVIELASNDFIDNDAINETMVLTGDLATLVKIYATLYHNILTIDTLLEGYVDNDYLLEQMAVSSSTVVAKVTQFTVTFNANGGTTPSPTSKIVTYGTPFGTLATTTRSGYNFVGWNTTPASGGTYINPSTTVTLTANQTLYARWSVIPVQWVNGGTSPSGGDSCEVLGDAGNIKCDISCNFVPKGTYYSSVDISNNPDCGQGVSKFVCVKQSPTSWLCNIYEGEVTYTNCKTCVVK